VRLGKLRSIVLEWYGPRRHAYAWRRGRRTPYRVLVSEVMLQQTQAARVEPVFEAFIERFPDVGALASASRAAVLCAWDGLGYNRRAVALHEAARAIVREHGDRLPRDPEALQRLPGVGPYTAAAVASIGFGVPVAAMDTNAKRICARVFHGAELDEVPAGALAMDGQAWLDADVPGDWNQALMDLGRVACRPAPRCVICPVAPACRFHALGRTGRSSGRRQPPFQGSTRQARGAIVNALRDRPSIDPDGLASATALDRRTVAAVADDLVRDGLVERTRAGRLRLPRR
jgi:A/G-specific adenine glycosylase